MVHILLVCSAGMSTSIMVEKMRTEAVMRGLAAEIWACPAAEVEKNVGRADVLLLGPQVAFMRSQMEGVAGGTPVDVIDMRAYGRMDGEKVLDQALTLIDRE